MHFPITPAQQALFRDPGATIMIGSDHENHAQLAALSPATRAELSRHFR